VKHDLLCSIYKFYEYSGQSNILEEKTNRRRRFVAQSLCNPNFVILFGILPE